MFKVTGPLICFALAGLMALACGPSAAPSSPGGGAQPAANDQPRSGGILKALQREDLPSTSIHEESTISTSFPVMASYNNLVMFDPTKAPETLQTIVPEMADKWEQSPDGKGVTFQLKKGIKWHDGTPFTAKDVKHTFDTLKTGTDSMRPDVKMRANPRGIWYGNLESVTAVDDSTVKFNLKNPQPSLMGMLATGYSPIYPSHVPMDSLRAKPTGTGPFKFQEWRKGELISYTKNADYWIPGRPYMDGVQYMVITERGTQLAAMRTKQIMLSFPGEWTKIDAEQLKQTNPDIVVDQQVNTVMDNIPMNTKKAPWNNEKVRQAVAEAVDLNGYVAARSGGAVVGTNVSPNSPFAFSKEDMAKLPGYGGNIEQRRIKAKQLLSEAGFANGFNTEVLTRNVRIYNDLAAFLTDQLDRVGIKATVKVLETPIYTATVSKGEYEIALNLTGSGFDDPDVMFNENLRCGTLRNYSQFCDQEVDKLTDEQSAALDLNKRKEIVQKMDRLVIERASRPVLGWSIHYEAWWPEVRGYKALSSIYNAGRMDNVWLAK